MSTRRGSALASAIARDSQLPLSASPACGKVEAKLEQLQRRIRGVHARAQLGGDAYHAEMDAIATDLGGIKLELRGWAPKETTTWRAPEKKAP